MKKQTNLYQYVLFLFRSNIDLTNRNYRKLTVLNFFVARIAAINLFQIDVNHEITHDTDIAKVSSPRFLPFERAGGNAPVIFLLSGVPV